MAKKEKHDSKYYVDKVDKDYQRVRDFRVQKVEKQWMINHAWYRGWQNLKYDTQLKRLVWDDKDPFRFYVNEIYVVVRAIRSALTRNQPSWEVDPEPYGTMNPDETRVLSSYLDYLYEKLDIKQVIKEFTMYGLLYSHGIVEYGWDDEADDGEGCQWVDVLDPFDVYIDPMATGVQNARYVVKCMRKPIEEVKKNDKYQNTDDLKADNQLSSSTYKDYLIAQDYGSTQHGETDTIMIKEEWTRDTEEGGKIRVITTAGKTLLRNELTDYDKYPFIMFFPDINPNEIYGEGWVKNLVPLNRALNNLERNILEYNVLFSKGKYIADKDANVKGVTNENGQILRVSRNRRFEQMDIKPMSSTPFNQIQNMMRYIQDVGASHEAFMGQTPAGVTASVAIEQLVANNYNNLADMLDNLQMTLSELGEELLSLGYKYGNTSKKFRMALPESDEYVTGGVIGEGKELPEAVTIPEKSKVRVSIVSNIAHTKEARRDFLLNLYKMGIVDKRTVLEEAGLSADEILARIQAEKTGGVIPREAVNAPPPPPPAPIAPPEQVQAGPVGPMM